MLNFIKSVYSFLDFTTTKENDPLHARRNIPSPVSGLTLITFSDNNTHKNNPTNVVDSAAVRRPPPATVAKKDPGVIGFLDDVVDGLTSCTESVGFESSDERRVDDDHDHVVERIVITSDGDRERGLRAGGERKRSSRRKRREEREERKFPPPLSSLDRDGRPSFFLRPVRRDGRLELVEVKIDRREVLHVSRQDGRLRLNLVRDLVEEEDKIDVDTNNNNNNIIIIIIIIIIINKEEKEENLEKGIQIEKEIMEEEKIDDNIVVEEVEEEEKVGDIIGKGGEEEGESEKWVFPAVNDGAGDGFRRCNEVVSHSHHYNHHHNLHHNLHAWGQHCLTIR